MKKSLLEIILLILLSACSSENNTVTFSFELDIAAKETIKQIKSKGIWYKENGDGRYTFEKKDLPAIRQIYTNVVNKILPADRSVQVHERILNIATVEFRKHNIPYHIVIADGEKWLVWEEEHTSAVEKILKESTKRFVESIK